MFKGELYRFLRQPVPTDEDLAQGKGWPPGFVHLPRGVTAEWLRQLTAEQLVTVRTRTGFAKLEWQQIRERNEALDARVYARAAAWLIGIDRWDEARWADLEAQLVEAAARETQAAGDPSRRERPAGRRPTGWFGDGRREWFR